VGFIFHINLHLLHIFSFNCITTILFLVIPICDRFIGLLLVILNAHCHRLLYVLSHDRLVSFIIVIFLCSLLHCLFLCSSWS